MNEGELSPKESTSDSEFLSVITHELRSPLSEIKWVLGSLLSGEFGSMSPEQIDLLQKALSSNERALKLIEDMLTADRLDSSGNVSSIKEVDLLEKLQKIIKNINPESSIREVKVSLQDKTEDGAKVLGDAEKLSLVFENLLENALHFTPNGGKINVLVDKDDKNINISIEDNGIGIPEEDQSNIFNRFFRAQNASSMNSHGSGLGLYTVKKIVLQHKGKIWFKSREAKGSTFYVSLPLKN